MTVAGSSVSANEVKPRRSLNMTVALALHAAEPDPVGAAQHLVDDGLGDEAREGVARLLALEGDGDAVDERGAEQRPDPGDDRHRRR